MTLKTSAIVLATDLRPRRRQPGRAAQAADAVRIRGTVTAFAGSTLTVKTREGATDAIALADRLEDFRRRQGGRRDIKQGDFLAIASVSKGRWRQRRAGGGDLPGCAQRHRRGDRPWELEPNSRMTNGTVADVTEIAGRTVTLTYDNGQKKQIAIRRRHRW
jgi:hypothetical protein